MPYVAPYIKDTYQYLIDYKYDRTRRLVQVGQVRNRL